MRGSPDRLQTDWKSRYAVGAVPILCAVLFLASAAAHADADRVAEIAPQPLPQALSALVKQTSVQLIYLSSLAEGKQSKGARAGLRVREALSALLAGTGLRFEYLNDHTIRIIPSIGTNGGAPPAPSPAASAAATGPYATAQDAAEEIVVTATKREEPLGRIPLSARVLSAEDLSARGIENIADISAATPGAEFDVSTQFGAGILTSLSIRGINASKGAATTGVYIGDVPLQTPYTNISNSYPASFDLARVEVLRGPQGMLFGRSAEGGAVRFVPNEASTTQTVGLVLSDVAATEGGDFSVKQGAVIGGPLTEGVVGARFSALHQDDGGYVNRVNPLNGVTLESRANRSVLDALRVGLKIEPSESLSIVPTLSYQKTKVHDSPIFFTYLSAPTRGDLENGKLLAQPTDDTFTLGVVRINKLTGSARLTSDTSLFERSAKAVVDQTNAAGVSYFNGYGSPQGTAFPTSYLDAVADVLGLHQVQLAEELRLASVDPARMRWLVGGLYSHLRQNSTQNEYRVVAPGSPGITSANQLTQTEVSGFGQVEVAIAARWTLGAGLRVGWTRSNSTTQSGGFVNSGALTLSSGVSANALPVMPKYTLSYEPDSNNYYYLSAAKGFREGGSNANGVVPCGNTAVPGSYGPDSVWSFELGAKTRWLERRVQINASVFDILWSDVQENISDACGNGFTTNAGRVESAGFDLNAEASVRPRLRVTLDLGFNNPRYTKTVSLPDGQVIAVRGTGGGLPSVPAPWSGALLITYRWPVTATTTAYTSAEDVVHSHSPGPFTEQNPHWLLYDPRIRADPATNMLYLRGGLAWSNVNLDVFVSNALNQQPVLQLYADAPGSALLYAYTLRPRTIGMELSYKH